MGLGACPEELLAQVPLLELPPLRGEVRRHGGVDLLLDCYNSSPEALEAAIDRLEREPAAGRRLCVIGTMEELGAEEKRWHQRLGGRLAAAAVDVVFLVGRGAAWLREAIARAGGRGEILRNDEPSARRLAGVLRPGDRVLFKASRAEALERLAERVALLL
ncbi:MAG: glutamate ligase domain-containing protein, partial [Planctomycetota bacterium]